MKNVQDYQLKKCIFVETEEFDRVIKTVFGDSFEADFGTDGICVWSRGEGVETPDVNNGLSEYFDVEVTSVHCDDCDNIGVWICYKEEPKELMVLERENGWYGGYTKKDGEYYQEFNTNARGLFLSVKIYADKGYSVKYLDKAQEAEFMKGRTTFDEYMGKITQE